MSSAFTHILDSFSRQRGVRASLIVSAADGIAIESNLQIGEDGARVSALAASLYRKARLSAEAAGLGGVTFLRLRATEGHVCAAGKNEMVLVIVADARANIGLIRMEMLKALERLVI